MLEKFIWTCLSYKSESREEFANTKTIKIWADLNSFLSLIHSIRLIFEFNSQNKFRFISINFSNMLNMLT